MATDLIAKHLFRQIQIGFYRMNDGIVLMTKVKLIVIIDSWTSSMPEATHANTDSS